MVSGQIDILNWIDLLWLPISFFAVHKNQRFKVLFIILLGIVMVRLQVDMLNYLHFPNGFLGFIEMRPLYRGFWVYGFFNLVFIALSRLSPRTNIYVYIAASISIFIIAFCLSTAIMLL